MGLSSKSNKYIKPTEELHAEIERLNPFEAMLKNAISNAINLESTNAKLKLALTKLVERKEDQMGFFYTVKVHGGCGNELSNKIETAFGKLE